MGNPKLKWTAEEEEALRAGVEKHGAGKWRLIQKDPEFEECLSHRSNIDLKDKWRNLSVSASGLGSRDRCRGVLRLLLKGPDATPASSSPDTPVSSLLNDTVRNPLNVKVRISMIFEAIKALKEPNGSEIGAIRSFIEQKYEVPPQFRRLLSQKLKRLVHQNKLEKVQNRYRLKYPAFMKTYKPRQKNLAIRKPLKSALCCNADPAESIAYKIADAEAKTYLASEAVKASEKILRMSEEAKSLHLLAEEILEKCLRGEKMFFARS